MQLQPDIPTTLAPAVESALAWLNAQQNQRFEVSGLVDSDKAINAAPGEPFELGLVLCDGEICAKETVRFEPIESGYAFSLVAQSEPDVPPLLDPPPGVRANWLDLVLGKHEFVLLLFYRGLW